MQRTITGLWLAIGLGVLSTGCSPETPKPTEITIAADRQQGSGDRDERDDNRDDDDDRPTAYAVIGDVPYEPRSPQSALSLMPTLIQSINTDPQVTRAVHIGDIKSGSTKCTDAWFQSIFTSFSTFADPLVYTPGDNEWTDCHRANNGGFNPLNRLDKIREVFFATPGWTLGLKKRVRAQRNYPENVTWMQSKVVFSTFHVIGSNNGRAVWFGDRKDTVTLSPLVTVARPESPAEAASREAEYAGRNAANIKWLESTFDDAREEQAKGVVLFLQADMWHPEDRAAGAVFTAHQAFLEQLAALATKFKKPVLIICGDSHELRVDVGVPWFSLYGIAPVANITQLTVDRSIEDDIDWLKLTINPKSATVFAWQQVFVAVP